jgi:hypothetical protein
MVKLRSNRVRSLPFLLWFFGALGLCSCAAPAVMSSQWAFAMDRDDLLPPTFATEPEAPPAPPALQPTGPPPVRARSRPAPLPPLATDRNRTCLRALADEGVDFVEVAPVRGIRTPVEIVGRLGGVRLIPRVARAPLMDCELARTLVEIAPLLRSAGVTGLSFSGAYDYRNIRGSPHLSAHAHGLAIDVHAFETRAGMIDVTAEYPRDRSDWREDTVAACVGRPPTRSGRILRSLACRLRTHPAVRLILTPDDNADHASHFHIESFGSRQSMIVG